MSSVRETGGFTGEFRSRSVKRPFLADWALLFAGVALIGLAVMLDHTAGNERFLNVTMDRLNGYDAVHVPAGDQQASLTR